MNHFSRIDGELHGEGVPLSKIAREVGTPVYAPRREEDVLSNPARVAGPLPPHVVRRLSERIIDETRTLEREASGRG